MAFDGERYQSVDDISELPDYQRRQQKSLQIIQNGTPFMNNKRTYAFSPDMDATNNGNDIPMNKETKYVRCFISAKQKLCIKKLTFTVLLVNIRSLNKHLEELQVFLQNIWVPTNCDLSCWNLDTRGFSWKTLQYIRLSEINAKNRVGIVGSVAMFWREDILLLDSFATNYDESLGIKIRTNNENYILITYYVPPGFNKN